MADAVTTQATAVLTVDLPVRVQVPDGYKFTIPGPSGPCELTFTERPAPPRADGSWAEGVDDGKGTYLRSVASMRFQVTINDVVPLSDGSVRRIEGEIRGSAWDLLQTFLRAYAYVAGHLDAMLVIKPEAWTLDVLDPTTGWTVAGFPKMTGTVMPGPFGPKSTLTGGLAQLDAILRGVLVISLPDQLLMRAEVEVTLLDDLDHAILDTASALEIFIDQLIEEDINNAQDRKLVRKLQRRGNYSKYDSALRALGRQSLKDSHPSEPRDDVPLNFERLEFIFAVRNNIIHRGVRQFTLAALGNVYKSPYVARHKRFDGMMLDDRREVLGLVRGAQVIINWVRESTPPR